MSTTVMGNAVIGVLTRKMQKLHYSLVLANYQAIATTIIAVLLLGEALILHQPLRFSQYSSSQWGILAISSVLNSFM
jgi:hypothetical protein